MNNPNVAEDKVPSPITFPAPIALKEFINNLEISVNVTALLAMKSPLLAVVSAIDSIKTTSMKDKTMITEDTPPANPPVNFEEFVKNLEVVVEIQELLSLKATALAVIETICTIENDMRDNDLLDKGDIV